jgi:hypothetical protein
LHYCPFDFQRFFAFVGDDVRMQQSNIALISALLLTIQFTFVYQFSPDYWDNFVSASYLCKTALQDQCDILIHEVFLEHDEYCFVSFRYLPITICGELVTDHSCHLLGLDHSQLHVHGLLCYCNFGTERDYRQSQVALDQEYYLLFCAISISLCLFQDSSNGKLKNSQKCKAGSEEANFFNSAMDKRGGLGGGGLSGSFTMLIMVLLVWGLQCFLFQLVACKTLIGIIVSTSILVLIVITVLITFYA